VIERRDGSVENWIFLDLRIARLTGKNLTPYIKDSEGNNSCGEERSVKDIRQRLNLPGVESINVVITDKKDHYIDSVVLRKNH